MKAKLVRNVKKIAAVATGALFLGATLGMASVFAAGLSNLGPTSANPFLSNGHVNAVFVVGATAKPTDVLGAIDISSALAAAAAATHSSTVSGQITVGTLALKSKLSEYQLVTSNDTLFNSFTPLSSAVDISNATYTLANGTKVNASWQETFSFSTTTGQAPFVNGLNVEFPSQSFSITSTLKNRNDSDNAMPLMNDTEYLIGSTPMDLITITADNATFGALKSYSNVQIPSSLKVGTNTTINMLGIAKVLTATGSTNEIEFNINGGSTQTANLSTTVTIGKKVTLTFGKTILENSTGDYLSSLSVSSVSVIQNNSAANQFGLGPYNVSWTKPATAATGFIFTYTGKQTLDYSFSKATSFPIMANLSTVSLEPLVPSFKDSFNVSVSTGSAKTDTVTPLEVATTGTNTAAVELAFTHGLPSVAYGTDFRGNLTENGYGGPDLLLEHYQQILNLSSGNEISAASEYVFPRIHYYTNDTYYSNQSGDILFSRMTSKGAAVRVVYELPNGRDIALQYTDLGIFENGTTPTQNATVASIAKIYNYTAATTSNPIVITPTAGMSYSFDGYNLTIGEANFTNYTANSVTAPVHAFDAKITGPIASINQYAIVPGSAGLYATNGTLLTTAGVDNGYLGNLKFNGTELVYTDPLGDTQMVGITENKSSFNTNISTSTKNTTADTWGDYVTGVKFGKTASSATIAIPVENYTVSLAGAQTIIGQQNYTIGQTVSAGKLLGISGVSTISASGVDSNPNMAILDTEFVGSTNDVPVIVMGGPAVNTLAGDLLNMTASTPLSQFINETGVGPNEAMIELFNNVSEFGNQPALLVAGYYGNNTLEAAQVLSESLIGQPVVPLTGNKVVLSTATASYTGVKIVNSSS